MCEIFAVSSTKHMRVEPLLREFFSDSVEHPHGWGLAWRDKGRARLYKEPVTAVESAYLDYLLKLDIKPHLLIAHIRNATRGIVSYANCHPFLEQGSDGREWVFAHNGTVLDETALGARRPSQGDTDSEQLALALVERLDAAAEEAQGTLSFEQRFAVLEDAMAALSVGNKLNLVFSDGEYLYAHTNTDQATLFERQEEGCALLCSRPIGDGWEELPRCTLMAWRDGVPMRRGAAHGSSFDNELYMRIIAEEQQA
ncbi:MAG: class II glutamine amidotransferase [Atopobiaceae bacterium]|nr:class II glutamine amidotransferase [Atopobiaceae bacterium]